MLSRVLECFRKSWNTFVQGCNAFDSVGIYLYRVEMLSSRLECILEGWNAFDRVGIPLYRVAMLSTGLECSRQSWNASDRVGTLSAELEYLCTGLPCFRQSWNTFVQGCKAIDRVGIPLYRVGMVSSRLQCIL
jgi:hypothetical protein